MLFYTRDVVHRLNAVARDGLVVGVILFDQNQKPLSVVARADLGETEVSSSKHDLAVVEAFRAELQALVSDLQQLDQYIHENLENASLSLVLEPAKQVRAPDVEGAKAVVLARFD